MATLSHETLIARVRAGESLSQPEVTELASSPDILILGMLADEMRRTMRGTRVTFVRVASRALDEKSQSPLPPAAREVRLIGKPQSLAQAIAEVTAAKAVAKGLPVSGLSLADVESLAEGKAMQSALRDLRQAGLDMIAEAPLDRLVNAENALDAVTNAGYERIRLTVDRASADERLAMVFRAQELRSRFPIVAAIHPLPTVLNAFRPTTGYEDVKMVALARLAAPDIATVQVDWLRYGPKLAQVALTFGADDLDNVPAADDTPEGTRRTTLAEVRRNIEAAGFEPVERDGRFVVR